ncbi:hypothetical protein QEN19_003213 [Hanseniaspora menglaensis]
MDQQDNSLYRKNVFNGNSNNKTTQAYISDEDEDTHSYQHIGDSLSKDPKHLPESYSVDSFVRESSNFHQTPLKKNIKEDFDYEISLNPDDSNNLPGEDEESNKSYGIKTEDRDGGIDFSHSSNKVGSQSVIYKISTNGNSEHERNNIEHSRNSMILTDSMIQTVAKSPKKSVYSNNNNVGSFGFLGNNNENIILNNDQAQWRLYKGGANNRHRTRVNERQFQVSNENDFDSADFQNLNLPNPIHEHVKQISSEADSSSGSDVDSYNGKVPMKSMNAINNKFNNDDDKGNESVGPATEAANVFERLVNNNVLGKNTNNKVNTTQELEDEEKDDFLPPFGFDGKINKIDSYTPDQNNLVTGKSGLSNATTAVASADSNQNNKLNFDIQEKHKKDLSTTTPEDIGMIYHESNARWDWKGKQKNSQEVNSFNDSVMIASMAKKTKPLIVNSITNINNSNSFQNNSADVMNTEHIMAKQSFVNSRLVSKTAYNQNQEASDITNKIYNTNYDDGGVSDLSQPFRIQGLKDDSDNSYHHNFNEDDYDQKSIYQQDIDISENSEKINIGTESLDRNEDRYSVDINSISKSSFQMLSQMFDKSPFDLNLASSNMTDVLNNLSILNDLNPFLLKLDLSINDHIVFNQSNNSISRLFHLKELIMKSMHLKNLEFLTDGTHLHLEHLNLSDNDLIYFEEPNNLSPLISLKTLDLSRNKFNEHIRLDLSRLFPNLEYLNLNGNSDLQCLELIVPDDFNFKKISLNGTESLKQIKFFSATGAPKENVNIVIEEFQITKCNLNLLNSLATVNVGLIINNMKVSFSSVDTDALLNLSFPIIENLVVKNSIWNNKIMAKLNPNLKSLTLSNILSDINYFDLNDKNYLINLIKLTINHSNLSPPINPFCDFIKKNLGIINIKELNIMDNDAIRKKFFLGSEAKTTKVFRIAISMKFEHLLKMDGFDLLKLWEDKRHSI